jgi:hypothetical protein
MITPSRAAQRLRQHHGIEHATVTLLSRRLPGVFIAARSDLQGFTVYGDVDATTLRAAAEEALTRLQQGERQLAVHPNCGTNLVTAGLLSGVAALVAAGGRKRSWWWERLPSAILGATLALTVAAPLGRWAQENVTTSAQVGGLRVADVVALADGPVARHRVVIQWPEVRAIL